MNLLKLFFEKNLHHYCFFQTHQNLPSDLSFFHDSMTQSFDSKASNRFLLSHDKNILAKIIMDKFERHESPAKWLARDYLEKRCLFQTDARKEFRDAHTLKQLGLSTPTYYGWGLSPNPINDKAAIILMERIVDARPCSDVFETLSENERFHFLDRLCRQIAHVARYGYAFRDLHYDNILMTSNGQLTWLDAHLYHLPRNSHARWSMISSSLTAPKLAGENYRQYAEKRIKDLL